VATKPLAHNTRIDVYLKTYRRLPQLEHQTNVNPPLHLQIMHNHSSKLLMTLKLLRLLFTLIKAASSPVASRYVVSGFAKIAGSQIIRTQGLGHMRILQVDAVFARVSRFVCKPAKQLSMTA
jgi:hypothetical protein